MPDTRRPPLPHLPDDVDIISRVVGTDVRGTPYEYGLARLAKEVERLRERVAAILDGDDAELLARLPALMVQMDRVQERLAARRSTGTERTCYAADDGAIVTAPDFEGDA